MSVINIGNLWAVHQGFINKWDVIRKDGTVVQTDLSRDQAEQYLAEAA